MIKIGSKNSLYPHRHFTKHLMDVFGKSPWESNLNQEPSSLLIRWLKNDTGFPLQPSTHKNSKGKSKSTDWYLCANDQTKTTQEEWNRTKHQATTPGGSAACSWALGAQNQRRHESGNWNSGPGEVSQKEKTEVEARANPHRRAGKSRDRKNQFGAARPRLAKPRWENQSRQAAHGIRRAKMNSENQGRKRQNLASALYEPWTENKIRAEETMPNKILRGNQDDPTPSARIIAREKHLSRDRASWPEKHVLGHVDPDMLQKSPQESSDLTGHQSQKQTRILTNQKWDLKSRAESGSTSAPMRFSPVIVSFRALAAIRKRQRKSPIGYWERRTGPRRWMSGVQTGAKPVAWARNRENWLGKLALPTKTCSGKENQ
jgi:hypothetical protein